MAERAWTCRDALDWTAEYLARKGDEHPRRSAEWLLSAATGLSRVELYAYFDRPLSPDEREKFRASIERRAAGEPLQHVTGEMPFRHLVLRVEPGVFIPRPETEVLVDAVLEAISAVGEPLVVDLCTGSGAIAVSLAHEHRGARVWASDVSERAVEAARRNALYANVIDRVQMFQGDLFTPIPEDLAGRLVAVVSNPPYIPTGDLPDLPNEVLDFEPKTALDGGADGLDVARKIAVQSVDWLAPGGFLAIEVDEARAGALAEEMRADYEGVAVRKDLTGRDRIVVGNKLEARKP